MKPTHEMTIHTDGAARGNPGPAAFAFIIHQGGKPPLEEAGLLGSATNNVAEYTALVKALERARDMGARRLHIQSDSELLVKQMNGQYRVKNAQIMELYEQARELCGYFDQVDIRHVRRSANKEADRLCNKMLDGAGQTGRDDLVSHKGKAKGSHLERAGPHQADGPGSTVRARLIACLHDARDIWASGGAEKLDPEALWQDLEDILLERQLLRRPLGAFQTKHGRSSALPEEEG